MSEASAFSTTSSSGCGRPGECCPGRPLRIVVLTARPAVGAALADRLGPSSAQVSVPADGRVPEDPAPDIVIADVPSQDAGAMERALGLAARFRDAPVAVLALAGELPRESRIALYRAGILGCVGPEEDREELAARLESLLGAKRTAAAAVRRLRENSRHLDGQLRMAQRIQMDFLPHRMPEVAGGRFAARLEPAAWVAGDFYDIFRLDERHVGFYVADAVGHGIPAALLTVFVKKSLQTKRIHGKRYDLIPPGEALGLLNADLLSAALHETPFITMLYGIYNEATRQCAYARAGHPKPLLVGPQGTLEPLESDGPLLGIFKDAAFESRRRRLAPGERLLVYSDGAERVLPRRKADPDRMLEIIRAAALEPVETLLDALLDAVRAAAATESLADDVTLVALALDAAKPKA